MSESFEVKNLQKFLDVNYSKIVPFLKRIEETYENKHWGDGFIALQGMLEFKLELLWTIFLVGVSKKPIQLGPPLGLPAYLEILYKADIITVTQKSKLKSFQKGRNSVSHSVSNLLMGKKISNKTLDDQFKKGLEISKELDVILRKMVSEIIKNDSER